MADSQLDCCDAQLAGHCSTSRVTSLDSKTLLGSSEDCNRCARAYIEQTALVVLRVLHAWAQPLLSKHARSKHESPVKI